MPTGYEAEQYRNVSRIADALERIATALEFPTPDDPEAFAAALPIPQGCTGYWDAREGSAFRLLHDGETCPIHEEGSRAKGR